MEARTTGELHARYIVAGAVTHCKLSITGPAKNLSATARVNSLPRALVEIEFHPPETDDCSVPLRAIPLGVGTTSENLGWKVQNITVNAVARTFVRTPVLERSRRPRWKHGQYSAEALAEQKHVCELLAQSRELLKQMQEP